jgi:hypothetical protein
MAYNESSAKSVFASPAMAKKNRQDFAEIAENLVNCGQIVARRTGPAANAGSGVFVSGHPRRAWQNHRYRDSRPFF